MVCKLYATLGCELVYVHTQFYEDKLNRWSLMCFTTFHKFMLKMKPDSLQALRQELHYY